MDTALHHILNRFKRLRHIRRANKSRAEAPPFCDITSRQGPAVTLDGRTIRVCVNLSTAAHAQDAIASGADGVGLFKTEFLFMARAEEPTEQEQMLEYARAYEAIGDRPLIVRVLDVGGDKMLPYLDSLHENNPFLGVRGIRYGLKHPQLLATQLRALLRAAGSKRCYLMFPLVTDYSEWQEARALCFDVWEGLRDEGVALGSLRLGMMIEVPSAALMAQHFAPEVDFFSIGTNDLTQFVLASERDHPELSSKSDALHPAVLRLIQMSVQAAHQHGKWVSLSGVLAADEQATPFLLGLGIDELSVPLNAMAKVKNRVRTLTISQCEKLAEQALQQKSAREVRALLKS
ncbi:phosphoenolpyruvate--protein phosphotransferase [Dongshaea marina]|uniref:phosphoenolpyruvate--protein phosphotransferase n=1 Tax=Dongshaea marina TaxID=2047966 RepID=UPI000D3EB980|nr:putative PEP-binding protein [Dongshaea marina]